MIIMYNMATGGTEPLAMAATTIDRPSYGYPDMYNFFDPDNFLTLSAVLGSGDPYLQQQVHKPCLSPQQLSLRSQAMRAVAGDFSGVSEREIACDYRSSGSSNRAVHTSAPLARYRTISRAIRRHTQR